MERQLRIEDSILLVNGSPLNIPIVAERPQTAAYYTDTERILFADFWKAADFPDNQPLTIATWIKWSDSETSSNDIVSAGAGELFRKNTTGAASDMRTSRGATFDWGASVDGGKWYFVVLASDPNDFLHVVNYYVYDETEQLLSDEFIVNHIQLNGRELRLGGKGSADTGWGWVNALGTWKEKKSEAEIEVIWNNGDGVSYADLGDKGLDTNLYDWSDLSSTQTSDFRSIAPSTVEGTVTYPAI